MKRIPVYSIGAKTRKQSVPLLDLMSANDYESRSIDFGVTNKF